MSEKRVDIFNLFKNEGKLETLYVYQAKETIDDPYEKTKTLTYYNPLPIKGLIQQIGFSSLHYKYWGQIPIGSIQVIVAKKDKTLMLAADKIIYNDNHYKVYKDDSRNFQYIDRPDYSIFVLGLKNE
jgi:hypothetical protein